MICTPSVLWEFLTPPVGSVLEGCPISVRGWMTPCGNRHNGSMIYEVHSTSRLRTCFRNISTPPCITAAGCEASAERRWSIATIRRSCCSCIVVSGRHRWRHIHKTSPSSFAFHRSIPLARFALVSSYALRHCRAFFIFKIEPSSQEQKDGQNFNFEKLFSP